MTAKRRILHIVGGMNRGGVETWLMHVLRHIDRRQYQMDFLTHTTEPCAYDDEIRALGSQIIPCLNPTSKPLTYARNLHAVLENGRYDVLHSHVHHFSGWPLRAAAQAGVPVRIAHSHNDTSAVQARASLPRRAYLQLMTHWIDRYATHKLSASGLAASALFKAGWQTDPRHRLLYYGIDLTPFTAEADRSALRSSLNIPPDAFVIGHVGRFAEQKNHRFLIDIAAEVCRQAPDACFLLVGDGPLRPQIEQQAAQAGLQERMIFAGPRADVPALMTSVMDTFLFPSLHEGLGIVLVEAQAAGLPCIYSDVVPQDAEIIPHLVCTLSLDQPAAAWAQAVLACRERQTEISPAEALNRVRQSHFNIEQSVRDLMAVYDGES